MISDLTATLNGAMQDIKGLQDSANTRRRATECSARKVLLDGEALGLERAMEAITRHAKHVDIELDINIDARGYIPTFTIYWKDGTREVLHGEHIAAALGKRYTEENLELLDFHARGDDRNHEWDPDKSEWININHRVGIKF